MSREKEDYRENLRLLREHFGQSELIPLVEAAKYCGRCARLLRSDKSFPLKKVGGRYFVAAVSFARWLS